jgi:hypothetical protein
MKTLFHSNSLFSRIGRSLGLSSSLVSHTVSDTDFKQNKENGTGKDNSSFRMNPHMIFTLFVDIILFYFILAVDTVLTSGIFLRSPFRRKGNRRR